MHYDYIYTVCCFSNYNVIDPNDSRGGRLQQNIYNHLLFLNKYPYLFNKRILVILAQRGQHHETSIMLNKLALEFQSKSPHLDIRIVVHPNWGMTIGTMWDCFQWCKEQNITSDYWWTFDDDYICNHWQERESLLNQGFTMVGQWEIINWSDINRHHYLKCWELGYKIADGHIDDGVKKVLNRLGATTRAWTDGGYYMMKFNSLID